MKLIKCEFLEIAFILHAHQDIHECLAYKIQVYLSNEVSGVVITSFSDEPHFVACMTTKLFAQFVYCKSRISYNIAQLLKIKPLITSIVAS